MGWRTIVINTHSKISYKNNHLMFKDVNRTELIHLSEIDVIILETTNIAVTTMLLKRIIDENILLIFCDEKRMPVAKILPYVGRHDSILQINKQVNWSEAKKESAWLGILKQKLHNQAQLLKEIGYNSKADSIWELQKSLEKNDPGNREGHAARIMFSALFGQSFVRDKETDINAALNYGYTLILSMFSREIVITGCLSQLGLNHSNQFNPLNLASDLMEPFRPLIDRIVYENMDKEFIKLKKELIKIFNETYNYNGKRMFLTNIISDYTKKVVKYLNGEREEISQFSL